MKQILIILLFALSACMPSFDEREKKWDIERMERGIKIVKFSEYSLDGYRFYQFTPDFNSNKVCIIIFSTNNLVCIDKGTKNETKNETNNPDNNDNASFVMY